MSQPEHGRITSFNEVNSDNAPLGEIEEVSDGLISVDHLRENLRTGEAIILKGKRKQVAIGKDLLVKVNTSVGLNGTASKKNIEGELNKVRELSSLGYGPDMVMDLSIRRTQPPMYEQIAEIFGGPVGVLPHYLCFSSDGIDHGELLATIEDQARAGVAFFTLHPTPDKDLYLKSLRVRSTACTSRGGGIVIDDLLKNERRENIIADNFSEILGIIKNYGCAVSIGSTFRPSNVIEALDEVHLEEHDRQLKFINMAKEAGVPVMMEGVGHMTLDVISEYSEMVKKYKVPFMPLGPITTDAAVGEDHISNAIGGSYMAFLGAAHVLNTVTREEHTGKVPSKESIIESLRAVRIAEHSVNISRFKAKLEPDLDVIDKRANNYTCVVEGGIFTKSSERRFSMGCSRCGVECPLLINNKAVIETGQIQNGTVE